MGEEKTFLEKTQPKHILEICEDLLKMLLDSYRYPLQTSLTVYYEEMGTIQWLEMPDQAEEMRFNSPFCFEYRQTPPKCENNCKICDQSITLKYYRGEWQGPKLFLCHLHLWEMTYPLIVWGRLVGILYGGQVIVTEQLENWQVALEEVKEEVMWNPDGGEIPQNSNQLNEILKAVMDAKYLPDEKKKALKDILEKEKEKKIDIKKLLERYDKFKKFGKTLKKVVEDLFSAKAEAARREHIHEVSKNIGAKGDRMNTEPDQFWNTFNKAVESTLPNLKGYTVYKLDEYRQEYESELRYILDEGKILGNVDFEKFCGYIFEKLHKNGKKKRNRIIYYFLNENKVPEIFRDSFQQAAINWKKEAESASVVAIPLTESNGKIVGGLVCVCTSSKQVGGVGSLSSKKALKFYVDAFEDIAGVFSAVRTRYIAEERRKKELGQLTHELKVPLIAIRGADEFIMRTPGVKNFFDYDYPGDIWSWSELMGRLIDKADAMRYSGKKLNIKPVMTFILRDVIASAIRQSKLLLEERSFSPANISYSKERFQKFPPLWVDRNMFQQVIFNLLINAVKYAYKDPEAFRVEIEGNETDLTIIFRDWGPGIENGLEELIFEEGFRGPNAEYFDVTGQGLGLWMVRQIIEAHRGMVKVTNLKWPTEFTIYLHHSLTSQPLVLRKGE